MLCILTGSQRSISWSTHFGKTFLNYYTWWMAVSFEPVKQCNLNPGSRTDISGLSSLPTSGPSLEDWDSHDLFHRQNCQDCVNTVILHKILTSWWHWISYGVVKLRKLKTYRQNPLIKFSIFFSPLLAVRWRRKKGGVGEKKRKGEKRQWKRNSAFWFHWGLNLHRVEKNFRCSHS